MLDGFKSDAEDNTDELRLWAKHLEDAIYRGEPIFEQMSEVALFLDNFNAFKRAELRLELEKHQQECRKEIMALSKRNVSIKQMTEPYEEDLLKDSCKTVNEICCLNQARTKPH